MKNIKSAIAILGVILLVGMYLLTLVFALIDSPWAFRALKISIGMTILIPVLLWVYLTMFRYIKSRKEENSDASSDAEGTD